MKIVKEEKIPPDILYHGTARRFLTEIKESGLLPQSRQYVHLSQDIEAAKNVGKRHDHQPLVLVLDATAEFGTIMDIQTADITGRIYEPLIAAEPSLVILS